MNKLTPIFIAGSLAVSAGLAIAQNRMSKNAPMPGHSMPVSDNRAPEAFVVANVATHKEPDA